jgi:hypothetical protein
MRGCTVLSAAIIVGSIFNAGNAAAQERPGPAIDVTAGWAGFVDESIIDHASAGVSARVFVTPRLSLGPELTYMIGPGTDRDLFMMGAVVYEWPLLAARVVPYVMGSAGAMRHRSRFGAFVGYTHAYAGGTGVRFRIADRVFAGGEVRLGIEPHFRMGGIVTIRAGS